MDYDFPRGMHVKVFSLPGTGDGFLYSLVSLWWIFGGGTYLTVSGKSLYFSQIFPSCLSFFEIFMIFASFLSLTQSGPLGFSPCIHLWVFLLVSNLWVSLLDSYVGTKFSSTPDYPSRMFQPFLSFY